MQTRKFLNEYSHGDLTAKVLPPETFLLYTVSSYDASLSDTSEIEAEAKTAAENSDTYIDYP